MKKKKFIAPKPLLTAVKFGGLIGLILKHKLKHKTMIPEDYVPFGEQWKNEILKHSKSQIVDVFLKPALLKNQEQEEEIEKLKKQVAFFKKAGINLVEEKNQKRNESQLICADLKCKEPAICGGYCGNHCNCRA